MRHYPKIKKVAVPIGRQLLVRQWDAWWRHISGNTALPTPELLSREQFIIGVDGNVFSTKLIGSAIYDPEQCLIRIKKIDGNALCGLGLMLLGATDE